MVERERSGHLNKIQEQRREAERFLDESAFPTLAEDPNLKKTKPDLKVTRIPLNEVAGKKDNAGIVLRWEIYNTIRMGKRDYSCKMVEIFCDPKGRITVKGDWFFGSTVLPRRKWFSHEKDQERALIDAVRHPQVIKKHIRQNRIDVPNA